jgi:WD40 repeat protein
MLILRSAIAPVTKLAFSADGLSLVAGSGDGVQVWPRWLDAPPRKAVRELYDLEDCAFAPDGKSVFLYLSGNSRTQRLDVATGKRPACGVPASSPCWFHFDDEGGYFIVCHGRGDLVRFEYTPAARKRLPETWTVKRKTVGSHYRFGAVCGPAGVFVALEYLFGAGEKIDGLVVRSVTDGSVLRHQKVKTRDSNLLLNCAARQLTIHPSGTYFAFPVRSKIRLWPLADDVRVPEAVANANRFQFTAVAFHPSGSLLAAGCNDGRVKLYDSATWRVDREFAWDIGKPRSVCFSPDGTRAAAGGDTGTIGVWDVDL